MKRKGLKIALLSISAIVVVFVGVTFGYRVVKADGIIEHQVFTSEESALASVLLITQDRPFKRAVLHELVELSREDSFDLEVVDVTQADFGDLDLWDHVIVLGSIQSGDVNPEIRSFLESPFYDPETVTLLFTTDSGKWKNFIPEVDAFTAASRDKNVSGFVDAITIGLE